MAARRKSIPSYLLHTQTGRARAVWTASGIRQFRMLPGPFNSAESRAAFRTLLLEVESSPLPSMETEGTTIADLLLAYMVHADQHYRGPDGKPTSEIYEIRLVVRALRELYAEKLVIEFGPLSVKAARQKWVNEGRSRTECNRRVGVVKRIFKWAASEQLAPIAVYQAIATISGLQKGRTPAREKEPIGPVDDAVVDATLPYLNRHVRGLVEFQRLTGCRPGEACAIRRSEIDTCGSTWLYKPRHHKTAHRGLSRVIPIGPKAQTLLRDFFTPMIENYLFSPAQAVAEMLAERSANRATPRFPSHMIRNVAKRKKQPRRSPSAKYNPQSYGLAVDRACDRAFPPPAPLAQREDETRARWLARLSAEQLAKVKAWQKAHRWHPNQLRHSFATRIRKDHGLEAAQVVLGHSRADVTQIYAEKNLDLAVKVASEVG